MKYFVESYGCTMNYGEGDELSDRMRSLGHVPSESPDDADIVVLNTCTVVETTEKNMLKRISELKSMGKEIIVTGCMAKAQPSRIQIRLPNSIILPPEDYDSFSDILEERYGCSEPVETVNGTFSAILPIAQGCLGSCSYCITRIARGRLRSYPPEELIERFKKMVNNGAKEIMVTAQDTACYGMDIGTDLPSLLGEMIGIPGEYRIRIGMMNPNSLAPILDGLLDIMKDPRIYRFLHIPVQSGSDAVLERMNRRYRVTDFTDLLRSIRNTFPEMSIATDMISGFPGETDDDHKESIDLIRNIGADTVNITRFSPRPGTPASEMDCQVHGRTSKERSRELTSVKSDAAAERNAKMVGTIQNVLVTEHGKPGTMIARTRNYRPVAIPSANLGTFVDVEITDSESTHLLGKIVK